MRDTTDKIKMDVARKAEMREKLMSSTAKTTELPRHNVKKKVVTTVLVRRNRTFIFRKKFMGTVDRRRH